VLGGACQKPAPFWKAARLTFPENVLYLFFLYFNPLPFFDMVNKVSVNAFTAALSA